MAKILNLDKQSNEPGITGIDWANPLNFIEETKPTLWLFLVGGSAAAILNPLIRYFNKQLQNEYELVVPVLIDRECHSAHTSAAIKVVAQYEHYSKITCGKTNFALPYLFIEDSPAAVMSTKLQELLNAISAKDLVFVSGSIHSTFNTQVLLQIGRHLSPYIPAQKINYGIVLPHLAFATNDSAIDVFKVRRRTEQEDLASQLESLEKNTDKASLKFVIGLSSKSLVDENDYQINPMNLVHLVLAYAISMPPTTDEGWMYYTYQSFSGTKPYDILKPEDFIKNPSFRESLIRQDFLYQSLIFLSSTGRLPALLSNDKAILDCIISFLKYGVDNVLQLGDRTIHREAGMYLRNPNELNVAQLNFNFKGNGIFCRHTKMSKNSFAKELLKHVNSAHLVNSSMAAHETIRSINSFIDNNFATIAKLYF